MTALENSLALSTKVEQFSTPGHVPNRNACTHPPGDVYEAASFKLGRARGWLPVVEWINKWNIHTMEYYTATNE